MEPEQEIDQFRPMPFYFLDSPDPADYTTEAVDSAMQRIKDLGYGGIVLFNKHEFGFDAKGYLSDFWFTVVERFIQASRNLKLQMWINDGFDCPPGDVAGRIEAVDPSLKQRRLKPNPEGRLEVVDVPWGFPAFEEPESSTYFRQFVYEEYYKRLSAYFGNGITGFFSDADNRRFNAFVQGEMSEQYYPWSRHLSECFEAKFGYSIETKLKELFSGSDEQVRHDYWLICGELYQKWFAENYAWCQAHKVLYTFHTSDTCPFTYSACRRSAAFTEGDPLALLSHADRPGTDHELMALDGGTHFDKRYYTPKVTLGGGTEFLELPLLNSTLHDLRAKYAASAAVLNGKKRVMCEMFAATNWSASFNDLQRIAAWQIIQGINFIVPHAVHHRFRRELKQFAPPEFLHSTLRHALRQFNDRLAFWCQAAASGDYCADYAVIDPTRKVWRGKDSEPFFQFCDQLNRRAEGYVVVPENYAGSIPNVIDPLKQIPELPSPQVTFTGGELAYMRRKLNGEEYLIAANVWDPKAVSGTLVFRRKSYEIELEPGEIAIVGGPFESYRKPEKHPVIQTLSGECEVSWKEPNVIPFDSRLDFTAPAGMKLSLLIPAENTGKIRFNGQDLSSPVRVKIFSDDYCRFDLTASDKNTIELEKATEFTTPALLQGEFDVSLTTSGDYDRLVYKQYSLDIYEPKEARFTLSPRRSRLNLSQGWEKQGQIFYSGEAVIRLGRIDISAGSFLELPGFRDIAELLVDGQPIGRLGLAPYRFALPEGAHDLSLRIWNMMANRMERYAAPSGLPRPPVIVR